MLAADIREGVQLAKIIRNVVLVCFASQQAVDDGHDLRAVDLIVSAEGAVAIAVDPAVLGGIADVFRRPIAGGNIVEAAELFHDFLGTISVDLEETDGHRGELGTGNGIVGGKDGLALTVGDAIVGEVLHIARVPRFTGNIRKLSVCRSGNGVTVLLCQQAGENRGGFTAGHAAGGTKGAVRIADDVNAVALGLLHFGDGQLTVFVGLALFRLVQISLDGDVLILLRVLLVVGHDDGNAMILVHIRAIGQLHGDAASLADRNFRTSNGTAGICADNLDGQRPAVTVRILIAAGDLAVLVGLTAAGGDGDLTCLVGFVGCVVIVLIRDVNAHVLHSALILDELHGDGGLVCVVQQTAVRQADGNAAVLVECNGGICDGILGVGIGDGHEIAAHNGFTLAVRGAAVVDLLDFSRFQFLAAVFAFLMLAARGIRGRLLVDDPIAGLVTDRLSVIALVGISATGAGVGGVTHLRAGGSRYFALVVVTKRLCQHSTALGAKLGFRAGRRRTRHMACRLVAFNAVIAAAGTAVFHDALTGAGGIGNKGALIPTMAECVSVVRHEAAAAAVAAMDGLATVLASGGNHMGFIIVREHRGDVLNVAVAANGAFTDGMTGCRASRRNGIGFVLMFALGCGGLLHLTAAGAQLQQLAICFAGGITDDDALPCVAQRVYIVTLFDFAALRTEVAIIAEGSAAGLHLVQQGEMMILAAALICAAITAAILVLTAAVRVTTAAGTRAVILGGFVTQPDLCHAVLGHFLALVAVGDLVVDHVLTGFCIIGSRGHGAAICAVAIADSGADACFREVADRDRVRLAVCDAVIVRDDGFCCCIVIVAIVTQSTLLHHCKAAIRRLGQHFCYHAVTLQFTAFGVVRAVAERTVGAALGGDSMVSVVCVLVGHGFVEFLRELGCTVIQPVDIFQIAVLAFAHICVDAAAGFTDGFRVVIPGIGRILAGNAVHRVALAVAADHSTVRVFHIAAECRLTVFRVLRHTKRKK